MNWLSRSSDDFFPSKMGRKDSPSIACPAGKSAPAAEVYNYFGITTENVVKAVEETIA